MASMLPGVGVAPRRRPLPARQGDHLGCSGRDYLRERTDPTSSPLDETALMARRRLEQKLGYLHPSSRTVKDHRQQGVDGGNKNRSGAKASSRMLISRTWNLGFGRLHKSERKVCAVCLDDFRICISLSNSIRKIGLWQKKSGYFPNKVYTGRLSHRHHRPWPCLYYISAAFYHVAHYP
ncbi:hypothetical protein CRG98_027695 [Punica granatum]|uniref:Uncharacterized protein n=1 Tax=Punica granatum TaxID=22663 RepID=A0A2I0J6Q7_PUNGR|nr:hypothetical protein CRG98_027695 [Punica granatum]